MNPNTIHTTLETMRKHGGSFARGLADLYAIADASNKAKLFSAFPEMFARYELMTREIAETEALRAAQEAAEEA